MAKLSEMSVDQFRSLVGMDEQIAKIMERVPDKEMAEEIIKQVHDEKKNMGLAVGLAVVKTRLNRYVMQEGEITTTTVILGAKDTKDGSGKKDSNLARYSVLVPTDDGWVLLEVANFGPKVHRLDDTEVEVEYPSLSEVKMMQDEYGWKFTDILKSEKLTDSEKLYNVLKDGNLITKLEDVPKLELYAPVITEITVERIWSSLAPGDNQDKYQILVLDDKEKPEPHPVMTFVSARQSEVSAFVSMSPRKFLRGNWMVEDLVDLCMEAVQATKDFKEAPAGPEGRRHTLGDAQVDYVEECMNGRKLLVVGSIGNVKVKGKNAKTVPIYATALIDVPIHNMVQSTIVPQPSAAAALPVKEEPKKIQEKPKPEKPQPSAATVVPVPVPVKEVPKKVEKNCGECGYAINGDEKAKVCKPCDFERKPESEPEPEKPQPSAAAAVQVPTQVPTVFEPVAQDDADELRAMFKMQCLKLFGGRKQVKDIAWDSWEKLKTIQEAIKRNGFDTVKGIYTVIVEEEMSK
jgi:hypothetical protein